VELTVTVTVGGADGAWLDAGGADGAWLGAALDEGLACTHGDGAGGVVSWFEHPAIRTTAAVAVDNAATSVLMAFMTVYFSPWANPRWLAKCCKGRLGGFLVPPVGKRAR
jgi:hypothetical protein